LTAFQFTNDYPNSAYVCESSGGFWAKGNQYHDLKAGEREAKLGFRIEKDKIELSGSVYTTNSQPITVCPIGSGYPIPSAGSKSTKDIMWFSTLGCKVQSIKELDKAHISGLYNLLTRTLIIDKQLGPNDALIRTTFSCQPVGK
jgi:hypothetical protein